jgi:hypothetical protein
VWARKVVALNEVSNTLDNVERVASVGVVVVEGGGRVLRLSLVPSWSTELTGARRMDRPIGQRCPAAQIQKDGVRDGGRRWSSFPRSRGEKK